MDEETLLLEVETGMEEAVEHMQAGFAGVRTGKASPSGGGSWQTQRV